MNMYASFIKRVLDFVISLIAIIVLSPLLIIVTIWLYIANKGGGAFFTPVRPGKNGKLFKLYKFKSMTDEVDDNGELLPDKERLTIIGRFVRSTSIDELPQLINVLKGDMAFVGPRPLGAPNLPYYNEEEQHRHDVRPGITGLAQINGRTSISWKQKIDYDLEYVENISFLLDLKILFLTVYKVLRKENVGVDTSGTSTFEEYREAQWRADNRFDLIEKARKESEIYRNMNKQAHGA